MKQILSHTLFPATFIAAFAIALACIARDVDADWVLGSITLGVVIIVATFERIIPEHSTWNESQEDVRTDLTHGAISMVLLPPLLEMGLKLLLLDVAIWLSAQAGGSIWPHEWPLLLQLVPAMLISQFAEYWGHRAMHEVPLLWRLHATHHSPGRLYWLNAARFHPLDTSILFCLGLTPLFILGAGPEVMLLITVWISVHGMFQHCNIRLRLGPLNYIFSMAELHRWHHSLKLEEANSNYGNNILFWDLVFGTVHYPKDRAASKHIGLSNLPNFPKTYIAQIISPWQWSRYENQNSDLSR